MPKVILVPVTLLLVALGSFFLVMCKSGNEKTDPAQAGISAAEKEKIIQFWSVYRSATDERLNEHWEAAADGYRKALDLNPKHEDAWYYLGNMYAELGRAKEAENCFLTLAGIDPKHARAYIQLGNLYLDAGELFDIDKAKAACQHALAINKEETGPVVLLGEISLIQGDLNEAAINFKQVVASNFKSVEAYYLGGYVAWKQGDKIHADSLFSKAIKYAKPADAPATKVIGEGDTKHGNGPHTVTSHSVFHTFISGLRDLEVINLRQSVEREYKQVDSFLGQYRRKIHQ